jgi:hypothetical protein
VAAFPGGDRRRNSGIDRSLHLHNASTNVDGVRAIFLGSSVETGMFAANPTDRIMAYRHVLAAGFMVTSALSCTVRG